MCNRASTRSLILTLAFSFATMHPTRAAADPITVSGTLDAAVTFALPVQDLRLAFPDFTIVIDPQTQLTPPFPPFAPNGTALSLTRTLGVFSAESFGIPGSATIDADVTGLLSFVGPTEILNVAPDARSGTVSGPVQISGFLRITQPDRVLFDGTLLGSGFATVVYEDRFGRGDIRLAGYTYQFSAVAATPEPASLLLVATGLAWVVRRRRYGCCASVQGNGHQSLSW